MVARSAAAMCLPAERDTFALHAEHMAVAVVLPPSLLPLLVSPARWLQVTVANRVLRLLSQTLLSFGVADVQLRGDGPGPPGMLTLLRPLAAPAFITSCHCNFVLPLKWVLPMQLYTLLVCLPMMQLYVCAIARTPGMLAQSQRACVLAKRTMHGVGLLLGRPPDTSDPGYSSQCEGLPGLLLLALYLYVLLLVVLPCLVLYLMELTAKVKFVQQSRAPRLQLAETWPIMTSGLVKSTTAAAGVLGTWFLCEMLLSSLAPQSCSAAGRLVFGPACRA